MANRSESEANRLDEATRESKIVAIAGALRGKLINSLITNEASAEQMLDY